MTTEREPLTDAECDAIREMIGSYRKGLGSQTEFERALIRAASAESAQEIAELRAQRDLLTHVDERGTAWTAPTGWAYMMSCHRAEKAEAALAEAKGVSDMQQGFFNAAMDRANAAERDLAAAREQVAQAGRVIAAANAIRQGCHGPGWYEFTRPYDEEYAAMLKADAGK